MKYILSLLAVLLSNSGHAQDISGAAEKFVAKLSAEQKTRALFPFDSGERFNWHFFPKNDRKGIAIRDLNSGQRQAAWELVRTCLQQKAVNQAQAIMSLESILKEQEHRSADDHYRDPENYYFSVFGIPASNTHWGWRLEGHHLSYSFVADKNKLISGTPAFTGSNPAIVAEGTQAGMEAMKEQSEPAYEFMKALDANQRKKAIISGEAPGEILTFVSRRASVEPQTGIFYNDLQPRQQQLLLSLIDSYIGRYTKLFADQMKKEIQQADLNKLSFSWAGSTEKGIGHPHYYRIQGPTLIIEFDNTQNNGNHIHSVVRDLKRDFGMDPLGEHYKESHN